MINTSIAIDQSPTNGIWPFKWEPYWAYKHEALRHGMVGLWHPSLGMTSGELRDSSGSSNQGTLAGMTDSDWVVGDHGYSLNFDGTDNVVTMPRKDSLVITGDISIFALIKKTSTGEYGGILAKANGSAWDFDLYIDGTDNLEFYSDTGTWSGASAALTNITDWKLVGFTRKGGNWDLWVDAVSVANGTEATAFPNNSAVMEIGRDGDWGGIAEFEGHINYAVLYNRGIDPREIETLYTDPKALIRRKPYRSPGEPIVAPPASTYFAGSLGLLGTGL